MTIKQCCLTEREVDLQSSEQARVSLGLSRRLSMSGHHGVKLAGDGRVPVWLGDSKPTRRREQKIARSSRRKADQLRKSGSAIPNVQAVV